MQLLYLMFRFLQLLIELANDFSLMRNLLLQGVLLLLDRSQS